MKIIAHRGIKAKFPENTLLSFREALKLPVYGIELDVHLVDGELVVIHDDTLERTTNGCGSIYDQSISELRALDAGRGEKIPLLSEVLDLVGNRTKLNIELKGVGTARPVCKLLSKYIGSGKLTYENFWLSSFISEEVVLARSSNSKIEISVLTEEVSDSAIVLAKMTSASSIGIGRKTITETFAEACRKDHLKVYVFTVNESAEFSRMKMLGVDAVFSDDPEIFL